MRKSLQATPPTRMLSLPPQTQTERHTDKKTHKRNVVFN